MMLYHDTFSTPLGNFSVAVDGRGAVVASVFGDLQILRDRLPGRLRNDPLGEEFVRTPGRLREVGAQVGRFFGGTLRDFTLELAPVGTPFQHKVWSLLREIPFGETRSYRDLARAAGSPGGSRAVGGANAANPVCLFIPCHRVIGADGSLAGYAFGTTVKRGLLLREGAWDPRRVYSGVRRKSDTRARHSFSRNACEIPVKVSARLAQYDLHALARIPLHIRPILC